MQFSLRDAARQVGTSKSTILRAVKSGRLSATRTDSGEYLIDAAELHRIYPVKRSAPLQERSTEERVDRCAPLPEAVSAFHDTPEALHAPPDMMELRIRTAQLEAQLEALRQIVAAERKQTEEMRQEWTRRIDELREERSAWRAQAERLALPAPSLAPASAPVPEPIPARRWWWRRAG